MTKKQKNAAEKIAAVELLQQLIDHECSQSDYRNIDTRFVDECVELILKIQNNKNPGE